MTTLVGSSTNIIGAGVARDLGIDNISFFSITIPGLAIAIPGLIFVSFLLPKLMPKIKKKFPKLDLKLVEDQTANILNMLYSGHLDLALIAKPYKTDNLNVQLIKKDYFHVAVPFQSALLKQPKKSLSNQDISGTNMLLLDEGHF